MWVWKSIRKRISGKYPDEILDCLDCLDGETGGLAPLAAVWREPPRSPPFTMRKNRKSANFDIELELHGFAGKLQSYKVYELREKYENTMQYRLAMLYSVYPLVNGLGPLTETFKEVFIFDEIQDTWVWYYYQFCYMFDEIGSARPDGATIQDTKKRLENSMETLILLLKIHYDLVCLCHRFLTLKKTADQKRVEEFVYTRMRRTKVVIERIIKEEVDRSMFHEFEFDILPRGWPSKWPAKMINCINTYQNQVDGVLLPSLLAFRNALSEAHIAHRTVKVAKPLVDFQEFGMGIVEILVDI